MSDFHPKDPKPYRPTAGDNRPMPWLDEPAAVQGHYADIDMLRRDLEELLSQIRRFETELENSMLNLAIRVNQDDERLVESHKEEWPKSLGDPGNAISYRYYKALNLRETTTAMYVRKRYEEAARDVTGTPALDLLSLTGLMKNEALLIREFLNAHVQQVDDSSEQRTIEIFQDWVQTGLKYASKFRAFWQTREAPEKLLPASEVTRSGPEEARQGQAVFRVKLNSHNDSMVKDIEFLKKNFSEFAPVFYTKFLGPALDFRLNVGRRTLPTGSKLGREIERAADELNDNLRMALADQYRRRMLFSRKVEDIFENLQYGDIYRQWIAQLAPMGAAIPDGPRTMIYREEAPVQVEHFEEILPTPEQEEQAVAQVVNVVTTIIQQQPEGTLIPDHNILSNRLSPDAHPQYLLRTGGAMTGDIHLAPGVKVDGMIPRTHRHTGEDGTPQLHGADIIGGTLGVDAVNPEEKPPAPTNLKVVGHRTTTVPPGVTAIDTSISWEGSSRWQYEVQITRVPEPGEL